MNWQSRYKLWLNSPSLDHEIKEALEAIKDDEVELEDCFYKTLDFGTGGMRGLIGPGSNRMNLYTVRKAACGLAAYIMEQGQEPTNRGVVIAYDSRHKSADFALEAALTLGTYGIKCYLFRELRPTPELSFAVRNLKAYAGIVITASHNPPEYNGLKVYGQDGGQLTPKESQKLINKVNVITNEFELKLASKDDLINEGLLKVIDNEIDEVYLEQLRTLSINPDIINNVANNISIVFSPLHGTAGKLVQKGLKAFGFTKVTVVNEQEMPDPNFSTVSTPNPEEPHAYNLAIQYGKKNNADLLLTTDPDADRMGIATKDLEGNYTLLSGNQTGALLLYYILSQKAERGILPENGVVLKTIVTSELGRAIATSFGVKTLDTLTGFKYISEKILQFEETGEFSFLFGYEESYGSLIGDFSRDKDAIQSCLIAAELTAYYKHKGMSLYEGLLEIFEKFGYYLEGLESFALKGKEGTKQIEYIMSLYRETPPTFDDSSISIIEDYQQKKREYLKTGKIEQIALPASNVLKYILDDGSWICLRPSGTEPKIKFYFGVHSSTYSESQMKLKKLKDTFMLDVERLLIK